MILKLIRFKKFFLLIIFLFISLLSLSFIQNKVLAASAEEERVAKLIEGAKKEGEMVIYGSMSVGDSAQLVNKFKIKYPFIDVKFNRGMPSPFLTRILAEYNANRYIVDVIMLGQFHIHQLMKKGILLKYQSPETKYYSSGFFDPNGYWNTAYISPQVIAYNTNLVRTTNAPKTYKDLLDVKWKGKMGMYDGDGELLSMWFQIVGEKEGTRFAQRLSTQNLKFVSSKAILAQLIAAGEFHVAVSMHAREIAKLQEDGAPVEWVPVEPVPTILYLISIPIHSRHPNASKLFVDFVLSKEGQELIKFFKRVPGRMDVMPDPPRLTQGLKLSPSDINQAENYAERLEQFKNIFHKKP